MKKLILLITITLSTVFSINSYACIGESLNEEEKKHLRLVSLESIAKEALSNERDGYIYAISVQIEKVISEKFMVGARGDCSAIHFDWDIEVSYPNIDKKKCMANLSYKYRDQKRFGKERTIVLKSLNCQTEPKDKYACETKTFHDNMCRKIGGCSYQVIVLYKNNKQIKKYIGTKIEQEVQCLNDLKAFSVEADF